MNPPAGVQPVAVTKPTATLPFTGAAVPVTSALAVGAGLVATGAAAVVASRRRIGLATASTTGGATQAHRATEPARLIEHTEATGPMIDGSSDPDLPAV